jgi:hypothetical protein
MAGRKADRRVPVLDIGRHLLRQVFLRIGKMLVCPYIACVRPAVRRIVL